MKRIRGIIISLGVRLAPLTVSAVREILSGDDIDIDRIGGYRDSWETIVGNCDSVLFLGGDEQSTTEWLSRLLGKETIDLRTTSDSKGVSGSHTINYQRAGRELLTPDELTQLGNDMCVYVLRGPHPFLSRKAWPGTTIPKPKSTLRHSEGRKSPHAR